jgi:bis(5'-nucleosyl)-tetraphosphatase (symmetrical)
MGRRIFVGDVQGCREELEALLEALRFDSAADELHPVGDLVNRGPDSAGTLRLLKGLGAGGVLGNHDVHALRALAGLRECKGRDTLDGWQDAPDRDELAVWLAARPYVRVWDDVVCVHAGLDPRWDDPLAALQDEDPVHPGPDGDFAVLVRYCDAEGNRPPRDWPPPDPPFRPWYEHWQEKPGETRTVVFGHWAREGLVVRDRVRGLDTGAVYGGELTAWIAEEDRLVSVPARRAYTPTTL